jgi:hypothetical protein
LGQKLPQYLTTPASALTPKAAATIGGRRVSFGPKADMVAQLASSRVEPAEELIDLTADFSCGTS